MNFFVGGTYMSRRYERVKKRKEIALRPKKELTFDHDGIAILLHVNYTRYQFLFRYGIDTFRWQMNFLASDDSDADADADVEADAEVDVDADVDALRRPICRVRTSELKAQ